MSHTFHIPVLGLGFTIDTPLKIARYGISSVVSVVDDILIERMRKFYTEKFGEEYELIKSGDEDSRAQRIKSYLNLLNRKVSEQFNELKNQLFEEGSDLTRYFDLLPDTSELKAKYERMLSVYDESSRKRLQEELKAEMTKGAIDINIMSKVDKINYTLKGDMLGDNFSDALAALRGFAESDLESSIVLSAGMNPRLYSYMENFSCFFPDETGRLRKKIILKVSDYRSAFIQAKFLIKKGLWVSEFRVESGLNCGGHAFATEGHLIGPILQEFKERREAMITELFSGYQASLKAKGIELDKAPSMRITMQGGIGTADENSFLMRHYQLDATGWGSPFLLVPEATNVDDETLANLAASDSSDFYLSGSSPLGIPFNNYKKSTAEEERRQRIEKGRPGSPCTKKFLVSNTEFTEKPICTASREYQNLKLKQLDAMDVSREEYVSRFEAITEKTCLCDGLCTTAYIKHGILKPKESRAVSICPGPNLAYFSHIFSLDEMVKHIYGKLDLIKNVNRSHMFINELKLYVDYFKKDVAMHMDNLDAKKEKQLQKFKDQLLAGVAYYKEFKEEINSHREACKEKFVADLQELEAQIKQLKIKVELPAMA